MQPRLAGPRGVAHSLQRPLLGMQRASYVSMNGTAELCHLQQGSGNPSDVSTRLSSFTEVHARHAESAGRTFFAGVWNVGVRVCEGTKNACFVEGSGDGSAGSRVSVGCVGAGCLCPWGDAGGPRDRRREHSEDEQKEHSCPEALLCTRTQLYVCHW